RQWVNFQPAMTALGVSAPVVPAPGPVPARTEAGPVPGEDPRDPRAVARHVRTAPYPPQNAWNGRIAGWPIPVTGRTSRRSASNTSASARREERSTVRIGASAAYVSCPWPALHGGG